MEPIRKALIESYKPREIENQTCVLCRGNGPFAVHLIEASLPEIGILPPHFLPQAKRDNRLRGGFTICTDCAPTCGKCGLPIRTRPVEAALAAMSENLPKNCSVALGEGYCRHANFLQRFLLRRREHPFINPFLIYLIKTDLAPVKPSADQGGAPAQITKPSSGVPVARHPRYRIGDKIFGRYVIERMLEGGMGRVYVVRNGSDRLVIKTVLGSSDQLDAFKAEAKIWIKLGQHQNVVQAFWVEEIAGMLCISAEYVAPDPLGRGHIGDYVASKRVTLQQILRWSAEFCYGMAHAHAEGLSVHRDIKPANLLVGSDGGLRITDFGLAREGTLPATAVGKISGTLPYMPPEQWAGKSNGFRTDVYAFGVVLFQLCFGVLPWRARNVEELRRQHSAPREIPQHPLAPIIVKALAVDPSARFASPAELLAAIERTALAQGLALPPKPGPVVDETAKLLAVASLNAVGGSQEALAAAECLTARYPDFAPGWTQLGRLKLENGDARAAFIACSQAVALDATRSAPWNNLGLSLKRLGNGGQAVEAFERAIDCDPQNAGAMANLGTLLTELGFAAKARIWLELAVKIAPDNWAYWVNLGSLYRHQGSRQQALQCYRKGFDLAPDRERARIKPLLE